MHLPHINPAHKCDAKGSFTSLPVIIWEQNPPHCCHYPVRHSTDGKKHIVLVCETLAAFHGFDSMGMQ